MKAQTLADNEALFKTLREAMKANGYTYARLAREIKVAEVTIKRIFSSRTCSLDRIMQICEAIGISFLDLAAMAKKEEDVDYFLSDEQEAYFSGRPAHFAILKDLAQGAKPQEIAGHWGLTENQLYKILRALEKLKLLEVHPNNQVRLGIKGNIRASHRGPFAKKVLRPQIIAFLDHVDRVLERDDVCMHSAEAGLSENHVEEFVEEIHALGAKYRARSLRDRTLLSSGKLKAVRWLFAFAPYKTDWRQF